jgi:uncharacterized membrane protein
MPVFWERPILALVVLFVVSYLTRWNIEEFTIWLVGFYLLFLGIHTVYMAHTMRPKGSKHGER